jgi:hypothetical protein
VFQPSQLVDKIPLFLIFVAQFSETKLIYMEQEEDGKEITKVLHRYTADKLSSFGELALM